MNALDFILKLANVLFYLLFLGATIYAIASPLPHDAVAMKGETYITPAYWINYVWVAIHVLLGGFVIYQWFESANKIAVEGVGWNFVLSVIFSILWLMCLKTGHYFLAFIFVFLTASTVSYLFYKLHNKFPASSWCDKIFMLGPFSLWHGWVVFFAVINLFQAFTSTHEGGPSVIQRIFVIIGIVFLTLTAISYVEYKKYRGDITGAAIIALGLFAIFSNQHDPWIHWISLVCAIVSLIYATRPYLFNLISPEENLPLLS